MSVATELVPDVYIPEQARRCPPPQRLATVTTLHRPSEKATAPAVRLTRRGIVALAAVVATVAVLLTGLAWASAPNTASGSPRAAAVDLVTVGPGDTLWSIATRVAPQRDPRAEVADLQRLNHLGAAALVPGQVLRTH